MRRLLSLFLVLFTLPLAACGPQLATLPVADFPLYKPNLTGVAEPATIRGTHEEAQGLFGTPGTSVGVFAINGKVSFEDDLLTAPIELVPGKQSLAIGYTHGRYYTTIPVMLDAKPGGRYVVKSDEDVHWMDGLKYDRIRKWLYIEDEITGEIVVPKTPDLIQTIEQRYELPTGADVATIRGTETDSAIEITAAFPVSIDGQIVPEGREANTLSPARWDPSKPVTLVPGVRAIAILMRSGSGNLYLPVLLDVKPGASYIARYEHSLKQFDSQRFFIYTVWVEDVVTGEIVVPKTDLRGRRLLTL